MAHPKLYQFIDSALDKLFESEDRRIDKVITELDAANRRMKGHQEPGFILAGKVYTPKSSNYRRTPGVATPSLSFQLSKQAHSFVRELTQLENDRAFIRQTVWQAAKDCEELADLRNALPEALVTLLPVFDGIPRTNEEGYTVRHNERASKQFKQISERIDFYWACRMIY